MSADLTIEDNGNYACEIRGMKSNVLASKTFRITVQGTTFDDKTFLPFLCTTENIFLPLISCYSE